MEFAVLGWPEDEPRLRLDYRRFSYAGKFVTGQTGVAVIRDTDAATDVNLQELPALPDGLSEADFAGDVLAAVAFNEDRTDPETLWLRYLSVRRDLRGSGRQLGPRLAAFITDRAADRGYKQVRIAVNNVFSYQALYKAGFAYTGEETGLAELVLERPVAFPVGSDDINESGSDESDPATANATQYQRGLTIFDNRTEQSVAEREFLSAKQKTGPPALLPAVDTDSGRLAAEFD